MILDIKQGTSTCTVNAMKIMPEPIVNTNTRNATTRPLLLTTRQERIRDSTERTTNPNSVFMAPRAGTAPR